MLKWKANLAQDSDRLYNAQQMINQLTQGLPLANESTVQLADTHLDENSDWSKINYNEYYLFDSLRGLNAPDKQSLIYDKGLTIKIGDSNEFIQLAITQDGIGVKYNNTNWLYLLNGSGDTGPMGPQGPKGDTGATGPQGASGKDAVIKVVTQAQYDALTDKTGLYVIQG